MAPIIFNSSAKSRREYFNTMNKILKVRYSDAITKSLTPCHVLSSCQVGQPVLGVCSFGEFIEGT